MKSCLVLLSTYNGEKYLEELVESVLKQEDVNVDILVRDDGSTDSTIKILKKYENSHMKVYSGPNLKSAKSFLDLIESAPLTYDYYALCDQDDVWKTDKLKAAILMLETTSRPALYSGAVYITDQNLENQRLSIHPNTFVDPLFGILMYGTPGCTFVFNKKLLVYLKEYIPSVCNMHDNWISFVCLAVNGQFFYDKNAYIYYRQHDNNVIGAKKHSLIEIIKEIILYNGVRRSDMTKEILNGYRKEMSPEVEEAFFTFAQYPCSLKLKMRLLFLPYHNEVRKRAFYKAKLQVLFNSI